MANTREVEIAERTLTIHEHSDVPESLLGSSTWDCALVLAHWLAHPPTWPPNYFRSKNIIELGAGTGIPGLVVASLGANVFLTDIPELLPGLRRNIIANNLCENADVKTLRWGNDEDVSAISEAVPSFDIILMSDLLYDLNNTRLLCDTLKRLAGPETHILMAYELRHGTTDCFKVLFREGFRWSKVSQEQLHPLWQSDDIGVFRVFKQN